MKRLTLLLGIMLLTVSIAFSQRFANFITYVNSLPEEDRTAVIDSFMTAVEPSGFPYLTGDSANFIYRGDVANIRIAGDFNGWDPGFYYLANVAGTDFYHRSMTFELTARLDYKYVINTTDWILDPLNPNTCAGGYGPNSELAMPAYVQPWEIEQYPGTPQGNIVPDQLASTNTASTFQIKIYLPPGYDENLPGGYPTAYFQDGHEYIDLGYANNVLDNLIDSGMCAPIIAVFVRPNNRNEEYAGSKRNQYRLFFAEELVPYIDGEYNTIAQARARAVIGPSFGGNISALISYNHPDVFGKCGIHSGAFWPNDFEAFHLITEGEVKPIQWASIWGTYEGLWENMRAFRDYLEGSGYELQWQELPEGHSWGLWRATMDQMFPYFFPPGFLGQEELALTGNARVNIFPNPANEQVTIASDTRIDMIRVIDMAGRIIEEKCPASMMMVLPVTFLNPGIYFIRIFTEESVGTNKLVICNQSL